MNMPMNKLNTQASSNSWWNTKSSHKFETQMCGGLFHDFLYSGQKHNTKLIWSHASSGPKSSFIPHWNRLLILQSMHPISQD
jgi:hypothetical protein